MLFKIYLEIFHSLPWLYCKIQICAIVHNINFCFFISTAAEGWGEKKICTKEVCDHQKEGEGGDRNLPAQDCYYFGKPLCPQTEFLIGQFSFTCQSQAKRLHFPIAGKEWCLTLLKMNFLIFSLRATTPCSCKAWLFFSFEGGWGQGTAEHKLEAVFKCSSEHAVSHALLSGQKDALFRLSPINPLHDKISMHILHPVLHTFPKRLTRRICLTVKNCFS